MRANNIVGLILGLIVGVRVLRRDPFHYMDGVLLGISALLIYV